MEFQDLWFVHFSRYVGFWPGMLIMFILYIVALNAAFSVYGSRWVRFAYTVGLTLSMWVVWNILQLVVLY